jgi:hypothetical protein
MMGANDYRLKAMLFQTLNQNDENFSASKNRFSNSIEAL